MKKGDYVKLIDGGDDWPLFGFYNNYVYKILNPENRNHSSAETSKEGYVVVIIDEEKGRRGYATLKQIQIADNKSLKYKLLKCNIV